MLTVVIPAHNEEGSIGAVIDAARGSSAVGQLVVVSDASTDSTTAVARASGCQVLETSAGDKGTAMAAGLAAAEHPDTLFLDADLIGLVPGHIDALAAASPIGGMVVGLRDGAPPTGLPPLSGERRVPTAWARGLPLAGLGYRAELAIDAAAARDGLPHRHVSLVGVTNPSRTWRHPLQWADLAFFALVHAPALVDYTIQDALSGA